MTQAQEVKLAIQLYYGSMSSINAADLIQHMVQDKIDRNEPAAHPHAGCSKPFTDRNMCAIDAAKSESDKPFNSEALLRLLVDGKVTPTVPMAHPSLGHSVAFNGPMGGFYFRDDSILFVSPYYTIASETPNPLEVEAHITQMYNTLKAHNIHLEFQDGMWRWHSKAPHADFICNGFTSATSAYEDAIQTFKLNT